MAENFERIGFYKKQQSFQTAHAYVTVNGTSLLSQYGMELVSYEISAPEPILRYIEIPGRPGGLDATLALNGKINYNRRHIKCEFHIRQISAAALETMLTGLYKAINGTEIKLGFSFDSGYYYKGRFNIAVKKTNAVTANITIESDNVYPFKLREFSKIVTLTSATELSVYCFSGMDENTAPVVTCAQAGVSVRFGTTTFELQQGDNTLYGVHFGNSANYLYFTGSGRVDIKWEGGTI